MAGTTTAERGERQAPPSRPQPPSPRRGGLSRRGLLVTAVAAALLAAGAVWLLYGSPWLRAERVTVGGTRVLTQAQVLDAAAVPARGPLLAVDTDAIEQRLLDELPRIADVTVERSWPHTIDLKVTERTPAVLLKKGGKFIEVDEGGWRYATVTTAPKGVPLVELTLDRTLAVSHFGTKRLLRAAVTVASDLPDSVGRVTSVIRVGSYDHIELELSGGRTVMWGSPERGARKAAALKSLLKAAKGADRYDVSAPGAPAVAAG